MATNLTSYAQKLDLIINHGAERHLISLESANPDDTVTVLELAQYLEDKFGVPQKAQKLIHKGKSLQDMSAGLSSYGIRSGSKIMLIGRKIAVEDDPNFIALAKINDSVDELQKRLGFLAKDFDGVKQGYLNHKQAVESVGKILKKTNGIIEEAMKNIELTDSLEVDAFLKNRRKNLIVKIQSLIERADGFIKALDSFTAKGSND